MRDDARLQGLGLRTEALGHDVAVAAAQAVARTVPLAVNAAIRKVNGRVSRKMRALQTQMEAVKAKQTTAEEALNKKNATFQAVAKHNEEYTEHAKRSREAFTALEDAMDLHDSKDSDFQKAKEDWKTLDASVLQATETLGKTKEEAEKAMEKKKQELDEMEKALEAEKAKRDEAEELLKEKEDALKKAGDFKKTKAEEHDKAEALMHEAREALDKNQLLLDEAITQLEKAMAEAREAAEKMKMLKEEHGSEKKGLEMLLKVRAAIETFYGKLDELTVSMEEQLAEKPAAVASAVLRQDPHLKPALEGYNEMVDTFYELHGMDSELYGTIRDAVAQIKHNTFAAILLQCDPGEALESAAEEKNDFTELQAKCGTGLWKFAGVKRAKFPKFNGESERVVDAWWDASLESDSMTDTVEAMEAGPQLGSEETPQETSPEESSVGSALPPGETPGDSEETSPGSEHAPEENPAESEAPPTEAKLSSEQSPTQSEDTLTGSELSPEGTQSQPESENSPAEVDEEPPTEAELSPEQSQDESEKSPTEAELPPEQSSTVSDETPTEDEGELSPELAQSQVGSDGSKESAPPLESS